MFKHPFVWIEDNNTLSLSLSSSSSSKSFLNELKTTNCIVASIFGVTFSFILLYFIIFYTKPAFKHYSHILLMCSTVDILYLISECAIQGASNNIILNC